MITDAAEFGITVSAEIVCLYPSPNAFRDDVLRASLNAGLPSLRPVGDEAPATPDAFSFLVWEDHLLLGLHADRMMTLRELLPNGGHLRILSGQIAAERVPLLN
jgi:hypothetical protein